jgi:hypothetical protein
MLRFSLLTLLFLLGLSVIIAKSNAKHGHAFQKRAIRKTEQFRQLRHLMGTLVDTETDAVFNINGQKQSETSINKDVTSPVSAPAMPAVHASREEIACLAACHACVEDYPINHVS